jgi:hypothetical protein
MFNGITAGFRRRMTDAVSLAAVLRIAAALALLCIVSMTCAAQRSPISRTSSGAGLISASERAALLAIYKATGGEQWTHHEGWGGAAGTECAWHGVQCRPKDNNSQTVYSLELSNNNLNGNVPADILKLANLESLTLNGNHLTGLLPESMLQRSITNSLWLIADAAQMTTVSVIDYEASASALLCDQYRVLIRSDGSATRYTKMCRRRTPEDRETYCKVETAQIYPKEFAMLAWAIERNKFYGLEHRYSANVTEGGFYSTRVIRNGVPYEVVDYVQSGPIELWTIEQLIDGVSRSFEWETQPEIASCPRWDPGPEKAAK